MGKVSASSTAKPRAREEEIKIEGETEEEEEGGRDARNRLVPSELLRRLPGMNSNNIRDIARAVPNLVALARMEEDKIK